MRPRFPTLILLVLATLVAWLTFVDLTLGLLVGGLVTVARYVVPASDRVTRAKAGREPTAEELIRGRLAGGIIGFGLVFLVVWTVALFS